MASGKRTGFPGEGTPANVHSLKEFSEETTGADDTWTTIPGRGIVTRGRQQLDGRTVQYIRAHVHPPEVQLEQLRSVMTRARNSIQNSRLALSKSEQMMQGTLAKLRHLTGLPRGWFLTLCRRQVILYMTPTFPADDECEEVREAAIRNLAIQLDVQETRVPVSMIIKELVLQTHAGIDICSAQLPHAFTCRTPEKTALLRNSIPEIPDRKFCHTSSQENIQKRRASNEKRESGNSLENRIWGPRDATQVGPTLSSRRSPGTPLPVKDGCRLPVSSAASDRADDHTVVEPGGAAPHLARISRSAYVAEFSGSRVCVRGTHTEDALGTLRPFVFFLFLERDEGETQSITLSGSYLRTMVTRPKHLRWRVRQQLQSSENEEELLRC